MTTPLRHDPTRSSGGHDVGGASSAVNEVTVADQSQPRLSVGSVLGVSGRHPRGRRKAEIYLARLVIVVVVVGGWQLLASTKTIDTFLYGEPTGIYDQLKTWITSGTSQGSLVTQVRVTLLEALYGFVVGVIGGVIFGIALGRIRFLADVFGPFIKILNSIPRIVLGSVFTVAFGLGTTSKVLLAFVLVFFAVFFNAFQGVREVDRNLINNARILGASPWKVTTDVILPSAFTWILASLHVSFGFALIGALVGEFLGSNQGLGNLIRGAQNTFNPNGVYAAMVIIALVALVAEYLISQLEGRLLRWRPAQLSGPEL